jgi:hypothetical protein
MFYKLQPWTSVKVKTSTVLWNKPLSVCHVLHVLKCSLHNSMQLVQCGTFLSVCFISISKTTHFHWNLVLSQDYLSYKFVSYPYFTRSWFVEYILIHYSKKEEGHIWVHKNFKFAHARACVCVHACTIYSLSKYKFISALKGQWAM